MLRSAASATLRGPVFSRSSRYLGAVPLEISAPKRLRVVSALASRNHSISISAAISSSSEGATHTTQSGDGGQALRRAVALIAGSALGLWAISGHENKSVASCSSSQSMQGMMVTEDESETASPMTESAASASPTEEPTRTGAESVTLVVASTYNGNGPIEDRHDIRQSPRGDFFAAVFDGHGGWQAAELARKRLNIAAQTELKCSLADNPDQVKGALVQAFLRVEREYLYQVKSAFDLGFGAVASTGACAIMALIRDDWLYVANAGDCRAVLGRRRSSGWVGGVERNSQAEAVAMSNDHNAREETEQLKLRKLHPYEGDVFTCKRASSCYVKGRLQPTRSLGDAFLKYAEFNGLEGSHKSAGKFLQPPYTPPYITAEPEILIHNIDRAQDDFVIIASDGLWDHVSNDEAVAIVRAAAYEDGAPESAGDRLIKFVLERAAQNNGITVEELRQVPEGSTRRRMHDDITCVVFFLKGSANNNGFDSLEGCQVQGASTPKQDGGTPAQ